MIQKDSRLIVCSGKLRPICLLVLLIAAALPCFPAAAGKPNIILITLESTRSDRIGFMGSKNPTPSLNTLAKQSIVFERAYAQVPLTVSSHATILSGTYPQTHQASAMGIPLATTLPYLPDLLHGRGYRPYRTFREYERRNYPAR